MTASAEDYADAVGVESDGSYRLNWQEVVRLVGVANDLGAARLELLKALQTELSRDDDESVAELKDLLTNLIIMQTRLSGREKDLQQALSNLSDGPSHLEVEKQTIIDAAEAIVQTSEQIAQKV